MNQADQIRYSRQIRLPEVGLEGQQRLADASVLVIGAGGLGSPALHHLVGAGVGKVGVVEFDRVDVSNLHRQTLFSSEDIGVLKSDAALGRLEAINPGVDIDTHSTRLDASNAESLIGAYDLVLDGSDNFSTRYVVNEASVRTETPNVFASVSQFSGQASTFGTKDGPCYRCLFPEPPPPGLIPNCEDGGVLGVVPALMGTIQATEALKLVLGIGTTLIGRLLIFDALDLTMREIEIARDLECRTCGSGERIEKDSPLTELTADQLRHQLASVTPPLLIDVRSPEEHSSHNIGGVLMPLSDLDSRLGALEADRAIVVYCASGVRSEQAARLLQRQGFRVASLRGGLRAWE